jgi:hypothetical protein
MVTDIKNNKKNHKSVSSVISWQLFLLISKSNISSLLLTGTQRNFSAFFQNSPSPVENVSKGFIFLDETICLGFYFTVDYIITDDAGSRRKAQQ